MPTKRKFGDTLTGGTGDVNPQTYVLQSDPITAIAGAALNFGFNKGFPLPVPRYSASIGKSIVFELLSVDWYFVNVNPPPVVGEILGVFAAVTTDPFIPSGSALVQPFFSGFYSNPRHLSIFAKGIGTMTAVGWYEAVHYAEDNLTDQDGHGTLVATDNIYLQVVADPSATTAINCQITARLSYRLKEVSLTEYIGIVQSQQ